MGKSVAPELRRGGSVPGYSECFEQAVAAAISGATVLTSNTRSARAIRAAAEQRLRNTSTVWLTPDVIPFGAFVERLYSEAVVAGELTVQSLQREQELQLWRDVIERSASGRALLLQDSAAALASESFRTAAEYEIALDSPQMSASSDTRAFSGWAGEFQRQLSVHRWTCSAFLMQELTPALASLRLPTNIYIFLAETTPAQRRFMDELAAAGVRMSVVPDYVAEPSRRAVRYEFDGVADELRTAAQWARLQVESSPESRIGVIVFDLNRKRLQVEQAFRAVLHPEQLLGQRTPSAFEIALARPLAEYPVVSCAVQLLSLFAAPVGFHSFCSMLTSPYLDAEPGAVAKFIAQIRKHARREVSIEHLAKWLHESAYLPRLRTAIEALPKHSAFSTEQPVEYWADISRQILEAFGWPGRIRLTSEEFQCSQSWRDLLVSVSSLELLDWRTDFSGFVRRIQHAAATQNFKPETLNAPVQIMDVAESEGSVFDALWVASCSDDLWPDAPRHSPLIPLALLKEAGIAVPGTREAEARVQRITSRLSQSAPGVSLSRALRTNDEREQRWSPLFAEHPAATETIAMPSTLAEQFEAVNLDAISDSIAPALQLGELARGGTWLMQEQSNCPFRAFAVRRLLAKEAQGPNEAMAPTERGKVIELALQLIWEELKDSDGLCRPNRAAIVEAAVDDAMARELPATSDPWMMRFHKLERRRTIEVLTEWLTMESARKPFHVVGHQLDVELNLSGLALQGRLDRLDEIDDRHVVIDYKTGAANAVSAWQVPRPRMPQLPFYAVAMKQQKFNLAGVSFAIVRKGECTFKGYTREGNLLPCADPAKRNFEGIAFDEYTGRWAEELERLATSFVQGVAAVDPKIPKGKSNSSCEHCHLSALCRVGDLADAAYDDESEEETYE